MLYRKRHSSKLSQGKSSSYGVLDLRERVILKASFVNFIKTYLTAIKLLLSELANVFLMNIYCPQRRVRPVQKLCLDLSLSLDCQVIKLECKMNPALHRRVKLFYSVSGEKHHSLKVFKLSQKDGD
jgi:hypothetical protein